AAVVAEVLEHRALGALPPGEVLVVVDDHAAFGSDIGPERAGGGDEQRIAVVPGVADQGLQGVGEGHGVLVRRKGRQHGHRRPPVKPDGTLGVGYEFPRPRSCADTGAVHHRGEIMNFSDQGILVILLVGLVAGWLAGKIVRGAGFGVIGDICIGIVGAFIASWLLPRLHIGLGAGLVREIIDATIGAVILLLIVRLVSGGGRRW